MKRSSLQTFGIVFASLLIVGCQKAPALQGKVAGLRDLSQKAAENGAKLCAPRELALADAYLELAELELKRGEIIAAQKFAAKAEVHVRAATAQSPADQCTGPGDQDADGVFDDTDRCLTTKETWNGFEDEDGCPDDPDTDGDGIVDSLDACPTAAEDRDQYLDEDGCPDEDDDLDLIPDLTDQCPREGEDLDGYEDHDGCPEPDNDKDEVPDLMDQCPNTPGEKDREPKGCPIKNALVLVTDCEVKITQQIHFALGKDTIKPESYPILDAVTDVLVKNSSFKIEVQGHTDDKGSDAYNLDLSKRRAQSVRKYLVARGVSPDRLESQGYGEARPLVPNISEANRALNRRVQFLRTEGLGEGCGVTAPNASVSGKR